MTGAEPTGGGSTGWGRVPALDGFRGLAVIAVLLFHGGVGFARGGFLGVDAFFVLSGLLITSLLLTEVYEWGTVDLGRFWARRARRLLPALLAVVAAAAVFAALFASPDRLASLRLDALATLAYVANWRYIAAGADYFESTAQPSVLRHTWSLAIEEQFYVVWPLVVFALARTARFVRWTGVVAGLGALASVVTMWALFHPDEEPSRAYYGTDSRVHVVLIGALLAALIAAWTQRGRVLSVAAARVLGVGAAFGTVAFFAAVATLDGSEAILFRGGFLVIALAVAVVLAHVVLVPLGWSARALAWTPLRAIGVISYGLYLWHWPLFLTITKERTGVSGLGLLALRLAATGVVSVASYFALERPIRRGALPRWRAGVALPAVAAVTVVAVLASTMPPSTPRRAVTVAVAPLAEDGLPRPTRPTPPAGVPARLLVLGDSVAKTLADDYKRTMRKYDLAMTNHAVLGCGVVRGGPFRYFGEQRPALPSCQRWPEQWERSVKRVDPDVVFVIVGRWEVMDRVHQGRWTQLGDPVFDRYLDGELERMVRVTTQRRAILALATAPYFLRGERPDGGRWPEDDPTRVNRFNKILRTVADRHPDRVALLDLNSRTSRGGRYTPRIDRVDLRFDGVHFSPAGARYLEEWLLGTLRRLTPLPTDGRRPSSRTSTTVGGPDDDLDGDSDGDPTSTTTRPRSSTSTTRSTTTTRPPTSTTEAPTTTESPTTTSRPSTTLLPG